MPVQSELDFTQILHSKENNSHSQQILEKQEKRLSNNCKILYEALMRGERLSGRDVIDKYGMIEYRRRFCDLKEKGIPIKSEIVGNVKYWFIEK